ncbi:MAG TPA: MBL fold metallo-hydrolase [Nitrospirales bacterium]|nr:MBL fold metallo-hydrolase [Nitrospirales bacterium]
MHVTILGSGTNLHPVRAAAGYLIETDHPFLLDFGPRTLMNLLCTKVDRHNIEHLFFTHHHADHVADFIPFFFDTIITAKMSPSSSTRNALNIFGPTGTRRMFGSIFRTFPSFTPATFPIHIQNLGETSLLIGKMKIFTKYMTHTPSLRCLGYRIEYEGRLFAYSGDAQYSANLVTLCRDADVAVLDCSFPAEKPGSNHMTSKDCGRVAKEAGVKTLILSHFYPVCEDYDVKDQCAAVFGGTIIVGKDRMRLRI